MDVDLLRPGTVPISPDTVLWFEFLLNPSLLKNHLKGNKPDPSPTDLIVKFLSITPDKKDVEEAESSDGVNTEEVASKRSRKNLALKILSLKVAAFLKWDLGILESKLPLPMQVTLLHDLLFLALDKDVDVAAHSELELATGPSPLVFAVTLYHRWVLRAIMYHRLTTRQARLPYISIPGLQDPNCVPLNIIEELIRGLEGQAANSVAILSSLLDVPVPLVPTFETFVMLTEASTDVKQDWDNGMEISAEEFHCQLHFDLGSYHFFREEYDLARKHFTEASNLYKQLLESKTELWYCATTASQIQGYCDACEVGPSMAPGDLLHQLQRAMRDQYTGVVAILQADNLKHEIPQVYRDILELDIQGALSSGKFTVARDLLLQVQTLNVVCRVVTGVATCTDYVHRLRQGKTKAVDMLLNALKALLPEASETEKQRIKLFLLQMSEHASLTERITAMPEVKQLFWTQELDEMKARTSGSVKELPMLLLKANLELPDFPLHKNSRLEAGSLEQQMILTYDPKELRDLILKLGAMNPSKLLWRINNKWELPIPLQSVVMSLPRGHVQDYAYILLAKARELTTMKDFAAAQEHLSVVEREVKHSSAVGSNLTYKVTRLVSWEVLLIQITQFLAEWPNTSINTDALGTACRQCLSALQSGDSVIPRLEILEQCAVCLLNLGQWDHLTSLEKRWNYFELAAAIASACHDIAKYKGNKKVCKDAWDIVLPVYGPSPQQKRSSSGTTTVIHRDSPTHSGSPHNRAGLYQFLARLRDPTALAVAISLLARLHNVLRDEPSLELSVEYSGLWPAVVSNANSYHTRAVGEMLSQLLIQALKFHPNNASWLKLMADLNFVTGNHAVALKFYLKTAILVSDFFSQPLPRAVMDDNVYRRMIKCCSHLQCHTQAAVLCQFLEEVDYVTAFKSLGDVKSSSCSDAMDAYYSCIWDTTMLEYLVHLHTKRGEHRRKQQAIKVIGLLELNSNNNEEIQREAANIRKSRFLRAMARQYVC